MKPAFVALLCLACSLLSAGAAYAVFNALHGDPKPMVAPRVDDGASERIASLEDKLADMCGEIAELRKLPAPQPERQPEAKPVPEAETQPAKPPETVDASKLNELEARLKEFEEAEAAARKSREWLVENLGSADRDIRFDCAFELAGLARDGDEAAKRALTDALKSENADVRQAALDSIRMSELAEFMPALKDLVADPDADVREELAQTLSDMPADQAGPVLMLMLTDAEPDVLREVADALGDFKYKAAAADLLPLTRHANEEVAIEASIAMRKLGDSGPAESWVPTLGSRINSTDVEARRDAVEALRRLRVESARTYLEQALQDTDERVRRDAQRGLDDLND